MNFQPEIFLDGKSQNRTDCPFCGGKNTFSVSRNEGKILWYCFRQSCGERGINEKGLSKEEILAKYKQLTEPPKWTVPSHFVPPLSNEASLQFMKRWDILDAYTDQIFSGAYDIRDNRFAFRLADGLSYTGRSLDVAPAIRWLRYSDSSVPFLARPTSSDCKTVILVEDCISAIRATQGGLNGCALLGTNFVDSYLPFIGEFNKALICLDPDAAKKAWKIQKQLDGVIKTEVKFLKKDLKYYTREEVKEIFT